MTTRSSPRQAAQEAGRAIRRRAAVGAAAELFAVNGFHATAMADVARRAELSLKALYESFASKDELFSAVLQDVAERFATLFDDAQREDEPAEQLVAFVERLIEGMAGYPDALRLYARGNDGIPIALRSRGIDPFAAYTDRTLSAMAGLLRAAQGDRGGVDPDLLARALLATCVAEARRRLDAGLPVIDAARDLRPFALALVRGG